MRIKIETDRKLGTLTRLKVWKNTVLTSIGPILSRVAGSIC